MSRSRLYARAQKRTSPKASKEPQVSRIVNRAQTPVVHNHPGHPDQSVHGRRHKKLLPDGPNPPGGGERYPHPVEHTGEAARRAAEGRRSGETVHPKTGRRPRRQGDEGSFATGEKWAGGGHPDSDFDSMTPAQRRSAQRRAEREHRESWEQTPPGQRGMPVPDAPGERWPHPVEHTGEAARRAEEGRRSGETVRTKTVRKPRRRGDEGSFAPGERWPGAAGWFSISNFSDDVATVKIYNDIGGDPNGLTARAFETELSNVNAKRIDLRINSRGGDVFDGIAIHNALANHPAKVHVTVDGVAASIASVIAMAGDRVTMARGSQMMIHEGFTAMVGNAEVMAKTANLLNKTSDTIAGFYAARAGGTVAQWRDRMRSETWYSAEEAVAAGLADDTAPAPAMRNSMDLTVFAYAGRAAAPAPDVTRAAAAPQDSWAGLTGPLLASSMVDSALTPLLEAK